MPLCEWCHQRCADRGGQVRAAHGHWCKWCDKRWHDEKKDEHTWACGLLVGCRDALSGEGYLLFGFQKKWCNFHGHAEDEDATNIMVAIREGCEELCYALGSPRHVQKTFFDTGNYIQLTGNTYFVNLGYLALSERQGVIDTFKANRYGGNIFRGYLRGPEKEMTKLQWCKAKDFAKAVRKETFVVPSLGQEGFRGWTHGTYPSYFRKNHKFCEFCDTPKKTSPAEKRPREEGKDDVAVPVKKKLAKEDRASQTFEIGQNVVTKIRSHTNEALYRPADDVVCDNDDFGGHGKRLMALMKFGMHPCDEDDTKTTWSLTSVPDAEATSAKYYILSHKGEPLYRPSDDVVCDKEDFGGKRERVMALMWCGDSLETMSATAKEKATWTIVQSEDGSANRYHILSHKGEPLYRPADDVVCDKEDFGGNKERVMALMRCGESLTQCRDKKKATWCFAVSA